MKYNKLARTYQKASVFLLIISTLACSLAIGADWPNWRGPDYNGISQESGWNPKFPEEGPAVLWQASIGTGFSSISVSAGKAYTMGNKDDKDTVFCFDAATGDVLWKYTYAEPLAPIYYEGGTSATPTIADGKAYTISKSGKVFCFDAAKGDIIWQKDLQAKFKVEMPKWGFAGSAYITGDMAIFNAGKWGIALNKNTGDLIWQTGTEKAGYASAVPFTLDETKYIAVFGAKGIAALDPKSGKVQWQHEWKTNYDVNAADPIIVGDRVFIASGYNHGCARLKINGSEVTQEWQNGNMRSQMNGPVLWDGYLYGFDEKIFTCMNFRTGETMWSQKKFGKGGVTIADGKLIILSEQGELSIAEPSPKEFKVISSAKILSRKCWTVPVLANGRIYARNEKGDLVCIDVSGKKKLTSISTTDNTANWPQWRGVNRDGKTSETGLMKTWPDQGPKQLWSIDGLGLGYSTVSIVDGMLYTTGMVDKRGILFALDEDGDIKWKKDYGPEWIRSFKGVRTTPTINDGNVYVISGQGQAACFDATTGDEKWIVDTFKMFDGKYGSWGISESPLIIDDKVICTPGGSKATFVALDKKTGKVVWASKSLDEKSSYCSPILVKRGGREIIVTMLAKSLVGVDAADGEILWQDNFADYQQKPKEINPVTPLYHDGRIYATSGYDCGGAMYQLNEDGSKIQRKWVDTTLDCHHGGVILLDGNIYGANWKGNSGGDWVCMNWDTGKIVYEDVWQKNKGAMTYADGMFYCYDEDEGTVALVKASPDKFDVVSSFQITVGKGKYWAHPVVCNGVLYIRHGEFLMAYDIKAG